MHIHGLVSGECLVLCTCEGRAEEDIINWLLESEKLAFVKNDLIDGKVIRTRSACKIQEKHLNVRFSKKVFILRIIDSRKEKFKLDKAYTERFKDCVHNIITSPEIEILIIIHKGDYNKYTRRYKTKMKPSEFCMSEYGISNIKSAGIIRSVFLNADALIEAINKYSTYNNKNEHNLADILAQ